MQSLFLVLKSKEGRIALISIIIGILAASIGGYFTKDNDVLCNFVVIFSSIISMIGLERFINLLIMFRDE